MSCGLTWVTRTWPTEEYTNITNATKVMYTIQKPTSIIDMLTWSPTAYGLLYRNRSADFNGKKNVKYLDDTHANQLESLDAKSYRESWNDHQ